MGSFYDWSKEQNQAVREPERAAPPPSPEYRAPVRRTSVPPRRRAAQRRQQLRRRNQGIVIAIAAALLCILVLFIWRPWKSGGKPSALPGEDGQQGPAQVEGDGGSGVPLVDAPDWVTVNLLTVNEYSRPGTPLSQVNGVVVHYVGNPGTTAEQNRSYYDSLAQTHETWASSHFVIGIDGTVLQCVPLNEVAYCSNNRNNDTISIECCHPDDTGEFTPETTQSLTRLLNWLIDTYGREREEILRHYDVTGKECPRYFVQRPEEWENFLDALTFSSGT